MGTEQTSCLTPYVGGKDTEINKTAKGIYRKPSTGLTSSSNKNNGNYNKNYLLNSYQSAGFINTSSKKYSKFTFIDINKIITIQKFIRFSLSRKKFNERIELLSNIIELDSPVNLIKDKNTEITILSNNKGEQLSKELLTQKKIIPYEQTSYYRKTIRHYKPNKYLRSTELIFIDKYKNNNLYKGTWTLEKIFHGYGIFYVSGNKYEGFWNFGKLTGECRYFLQNNDYFIGNFKDGQAEGNGKYFHNDGTIYEGEWLNDQPSGKGKEIFIDGSMFDGIFENGVKKKGMFKWNDGSYYDGEIKNNLFEGKGKFHWKEGREYQGNWVGGKMWGEGVMKYLDGARYEGTFVNGKREGFGKYIWNKRKYYEGEWKKGKQDGKGYFFNKGKGINGIWKDGNIVCNFNSDVKTNYDSNNSNNTIITINNNSRIFSPNGYNDSVLSVNQSNNSGIDKIFFRMNTTQDKYKKTNYKLNDLTKRKTNEININITNRIKNNKKNINLKEKEKEIIKEKEKDIDKKNKKNNSRSIKTTYNKDLKKISQNSNNSFITTKETISVRRRNEIKKLNQTQENPSMKDNKIYRRKK